MLLLKLQQLWHRHPWSLSQSTPHIQAHFLHMHNSCLVLPTNIEVLIVRPQVQNYYSSTGYGDDLLWAASWLYHATGDQSYFDYVTGPNGKAFANWGNPTWKTAKAVMCGLLPKSPTATLSRTESGLIWVSQWNALQHPVASVFLAVIYSDYMLTSRTPMDHQIFVNFLLHRYALIADYVLGNNPMKMSYLVRYGDKYPQYVHHRGASIPTDAITGCSDGWKWFNSTDPNPNVAVGALVGGPFLNETFVDS
ncbi:Endoglucanase 2 [Camellia lanceoleosa]|uniref:Endoglucanase 2 n=1 Tax=Camellia lanceoleosa TaxID=1840588 RepID=A0ACC0I455_9ERIC|nr:Endoglucanase 2 [Camellia lanceoleosa]